jgi:lysophospholipase L1-like esterase
LALPSTWWPAEAYPKRLEALWAEEAKTPRLEILNLGISGTNSSSLVGILPEIIDTLSPDVMLGTNDSRTRGAGSFAVAPFATGIRTERESSIVAMQQITDAWNRARSLPPGLAGL